MKTWEKHLASIYYDPKEPASFSGSVNKIRKAVQAKKQFIISKARIKKWLSGQEVNTSNARVIRNFKKPRVIVDGINSLWDMDLMEMQDSKDDNDGKRYVLVVIDVFSKKADAEAVDSKQTKDVLEALTKILNRNSDPITLRSDRGGEFVNKKIANFLKDRGILHQITTNQTKANYAERFINTLKKKMTRYFLYKQNFRYVDELSNFIKSYNNTYHRSIEMKPSQVNSKSEDEVYETLYIYPYWKKMQSKHKKTKNKDTKSLKPYRFMIGQKVKLAFIRQPFDREYYQRWTSEIFTITDRKRLDNIPMYKVNDYSGDPIEGAFYESELQKIIFDEEGAFKIDKVLQTKGRGKNKQSLVSWVGWPKKYNQWIASSQIQAL